MKLSIIIPVYNVEHFIRKCLESLIKIPLSVEDYEIIVVNDGTRDNSMGIVAEYQDRKNLHVITQENKGLSAARNTGLKNAIGEWVYFLDSDDYLDAQLFKKLFNTSCGDNGVDIISGDFVYVKEGTICKSKFSIETEEDICLSGASFFTKYYGKINTMVWRNIYRRSFLVENGYYFTEGVYHEDVNWTPKCLATARKIYYSPIPFYYYLIREGSIVQSARNQKKLNDLLFVNEDLLSSSLQFDKKVQKIISDFVLNNLLVLNGQYELFKDKESFDQLNAILSIPAAHSCRFRLLYSFFKVFPGIVNPILSKRYGGVKQNKSF